MTKLTKDQLALRTKWTTALRSGEYRQGTGKLRNGDEFCCLGVLCDVSDLGRWNGGAYIARGLIESAEPPSVVNEAVGISDDKLLIGLMTMNDVARDDFATIAYAIDLDTLMRRGGCL